MKQVISFINDLQLNSSDSIVVAVSGGIDSMVLLHLLNEYKKEIQFKLIVAHVHHHKRIESDEELQFVQRTCEENDVIFESYHLTKEIDGNFHHESRNQRYEFFESLINKYNSNYLFTAHHADDQMETIIERFIRGSSMQGYGGIRLITQRNNHQLVRPLLLVNKEMIKSYQMEHSIEYREDLSNQSDDYLRNRLRHHVTPQLKTENSNTMEHIQKFSETIFEYYDFVNNIVKLQYNKIIIDNKIQNDQLKQEDTLIQKEIIRMYLRNNLFEDTMYLTDSHVDSIFSIIHSQRSNAFIHLPKNYVMIKEYNLLYIDKNNKDSLKDFAFEFNDYLSFDHFIIQQMDIDYSETGNDILRLNSKEIKLPLIIRNRKDGDIMSLLGTNGRKKIKDILIDQKIPLKDRNGIPILVDSNDVILWIPSIKKSKYDKKNNQFYDIVLKYDYVK